MFDCVSGGSSSNGVTYCTIKPSGGLIALVVILPVFGLSVAIAACCYCCRCCPVYKKRHPTDPQVVVVQPGIAMNPMVMKVPSPVITPLAGINMPPQSQLAAAPSNAVEDWLVKNDLADAAYATALRSAGVTSIDDFQYVTPEVMSSLSLTPVQRNKLNSALGKK